MDVHQMFQGVVIPAWATHLMYQNGNARYVYALSKDKMLPFEIGDEGLLARDEVIELMAHSFGEYMSGQWNCHVVEFVTQLEND